MRLIFALLFLLLFTVTCTKDNFTTKPQLKIKNVNSTEISGNQTLEFTIRLTDKEGDFTSFFGISTKTPGCPASDFIDSSLFEIPDAFLSSKNDDGDIVLDLSKSQRHSNLCPGPGSTFKTDTTVFSFWTKD
ncbi:MAG TPA: hypothetical protein VK588_08370, partial [Chitinophagaceae bacterium]|nr:hypothetical protein [Chitinophagaceae bacterium]